MSFQPSKRRHTGDLEGEPLNLIPIMNLLTILIPFLTLSAVFLKLSVLPTTLPSSSQEAQQQEKPEEEKQEDDKPALNLTISIEGDGFMVAGAGGVLGGPTEGGGPTIPKANDGTYDYEALTKKLVEIKKKYPDEKDVILIPSMNLPKQATEGQEQVASSVDIPYQVIVDTMDAVRRAPEPVVDTDGDGKTDDILFPGVIFSPGIL